MKPAASGDALVPLHRPACAHERVCKRKQSRPGQPGVGLGRGRELGVDSEMKLDLVEAEPGASPVCESGRFGNLPEAE